MLQRVKRNSLAKFPEETTDTAAEETPCCLFPPLGLLSRDLDRLFVTLRKSCKAMFLTGYVTDDRLYNQML